MTSTDRCAVQIGLRVPSRAPHGDVCSRVSARTPSVGWLLYRPRTDDDVITMGTGVSQPVFIAMELVDCDFGELGRMGRLSRCAMCEGFLLCFLALQDVHRVE